jgi:SAM-dependent methyltransferase
MADLGQFSNSCFDLIVHPVSNTFVPYVRPVWKEAYRVLRQGGALLSGFTNPAVYLFDWEMAERTGELHVRYKLPYSDATDLDEAQKQKRIADSEPMEFSHIRHPDRRTD